MGRTLSLAEMVEGTPGRQSSTPKPGREKGLELRKEQLVAPCGDRSCQGEPEAGH